MKATHKHTVPASLSAVINAHRDPRFYEEKQKHFGALSVEILQWEEGDNEKIIYRVKVTEPSRQPAFIRKSETDTYVEDSVLDTNNGTLTWKIIPEVAADKFSMGGLIEFTPDGEESTTINYHIEITVKIPLIGSKIEKYVLEKTEEETAKQTVYLGNWLAASAAQ